MYDFFNSPGDRGPAVLQVSERPAITIVETLRFRPYLWMPAFAGMTAVRLTVSNTNDRLPSDAIVPYFPASCRFAYGIIVVYYIHYEAL